VPAHCRRMRRTQCPTVHSRFASVVYQGGGRAYGSARQRNVSHCYVRSMQSQARSAAVTLLRAHVQRQQGKGSR